ncbi:MAG: single-stranded DNA-binding protein [Neisseriaceae bacterium]|nr:single-stranded DNA-binding protein [Neisseriaceae bacterium]
MSIQNSVISGNVGNNPTFTNVSRKDGTSVPVCNFSLASSDYRRNVDDAGNVDFKQVGETIWLDCRLWGSRAERLTKMLVKGMPVTVLARNIELHKTEKDGQTYSNLIVDVENVSVSLLSPRIEKVELRPAQAGETPDTAATETNSDIPF